MEIQKRTLQGFRLSPQQKRVWTLQQQESSQAQCAVLLAGELDSQALTTALAEVVKRHEILRTSFRCLPGMDVPLQVINEPGPVTLDQRDLSAFTATEQIKQLDALWEEARRQSCDFEEQMLVRFRLFRLSPNRHVLLVSVPTLCADSVGLRNLVAEISRCYGEQTLADEPVQYADVSEIQNELLEDEETEAGKDYWRKQDLSGHGPTLSFAHEANEPGLSCHAIAVAQGAEIDALARKHDTEAWVVLLASWHVLLWRLTGQAHLIVGTSFDGRNYEGLESALGLFCRYLPISAQLEPDTRFHELLAHLTGVTAEGREYQEYFTSADNFSFCFDCLDQPESYVAGGVSFTIYKEHACTEHFAVKLSCVRAGESLRLEFHYDAGRYEEADIECLAAEYQTLLQSVLADPQARVSELEVVSPAERQQLLIEWNDTAATYAVGQCVHQLFEQQVDERPEAVALVYEDQQLSYGELNRRANQVAHYLRRLGVGTEVPVGLCVERSLEMVMGLLGILKAGAAYLPLEPSSPGARLRFLLDDARVPVLLTQQHLRARLGEAPAELGYRVVCLDEDSEEIGRESEANPEVKVETENLAYLIYTSGSTGNPKAVGVSHGNLVNYVQAIEEVLLLEAGASYATVSTLAADLGNTVIYQALCGGGTLHVISSERLSDGALLGEYFSRHEIDVLKIVPSHLEALLGSAVLPRRRLVLGGEASSWELVRKVKQLQPQCEVINHYGPTEATVGALSNRVVDEGAEGNVPLGRPLGNVQAYVLDQRQQPVPVGVSGEIYLGGAGVSRGYLQRTELTAEKFIPDPFSGVSGGRLYRTGDVGRYGRDGKLEFEGRVDGQIKLRGYRVELGEIEASLRGHEAVESAVVLAREEQLVGYVVLQRQAREVLDGRRRYQLPNSMAIVQQNQVETDYQYEEIFDKESYLRHSVRLEPGMCVFDVGANIGMFTLYVTQRCLGARIYSFEPIGEVCAALRLNAELYGAQSVKVYECGLSDRERDESFTYYPRQTMMSGASAYADTEYEKEVVKLALRQTEGDGQALLLGEADELLQRRFETQTERCRLRRLSDVMREEGVERIDLLKVDVQRSELDVLLGVEEEDWQKIRQVVMEVHDRKETASAGRVDQIRELLERHGFAVVVEQEAALAGTDRFNLYAVREQSWNSTTESRCEYEPNEKQIVTSAELRRYLRETLPDYMVPSSLVLLEEWPLTPNGKLDKSALPEPKRVGTDGDVAKALTASEEMVASIWAEVLKLDQVDVETNFFELGGHSLLATQVVSRIREAFGIDLHLLTLFESPTVRGLARQVEIAMRLGQGTHTPPLQRSTRTSQMPLSFAQQRLWFLNQLKPESSFYNCPTALRLTGPLNVSALERTLREIIRRHEVLRTTFPSRKGEPVQVIAASLEFALPVTDLSELPIEEREQVARRLALEETEKPFDLAVGPLVRARLLRLGEAEHVALFTMHHIVSDGWSLGVLIKEVSQLYDAYTRGAESPLSELPIQYADYAVWQREWLHGEVLAKQLSYWRQQLAGAPEVLALPTDKIRPAVQTFRGATESLMLPAEVTGALKSLSRGEDVTLFMTLLSVWQILLHWYSGQEQIVIGTLIANRHQAATEELIGFFVNTLALRSDLSGNPTYRKLLRRVRETCLGAYAHQDLPFEKLVEELQPERSLGYAPIHQVGFTLRAEMASELRLRDLGLQEFAVTKLTSKLDLLLSGSDTVQGLKLVWEYDSDLFNALTITSISRNYEILLHHIIAHPDASLDELRKVLTEEHRKQQRDREQDAEVTDRQMMKSIKRRPISKSKTAATLT